MLTKQKLKQKLLDTGYFIDNDYLDHYVDLICTEFVNQGYIEKHHILPRAYFAAEGLKLDNSVMNIKKLSYADHCKAHWLLYWCTTSSLKTANAWTVQFMQTSYKKYTGLDKRKFQFNEDDFKLLEYYKTQIMYDAKNDAKNLFWSDQDISIVKQNYSKLGAEGVRPLLNFDRSVQAIRLCASLLHLRSPIYWSEEEIANLKLWYPIDGYFCFKKFKNKTKNAVQAKAHRLGLSSKWDWSKKELDLLIEYYPKQGAACKQYLKLKSISAINSKAKELGLSNPNIIWDEYDTAILIKYYSSMGTACVKFMRGQHSNSSIHNKAKKLHLHKIGWTQESEAIIIKYYPDYKAIKQKLEPMNIDCIYSKVK